jgi:hypothetical protein
VRRALPFIVTADHRPAALALRPPAAPRLRWRQLELFAGAA